MSKKMQAIDWKSDQSSAQKLGQNLIRFKQQKISGTLHVQSKVNNRKIRSRIIVLQDGQITYAGKSIPNVQELAEKIGQKYKPHVINVALGVAVEKVSSQSSIRELLGLLVKMRVLTWQEIEDFINHQVVLILEQLVPYPSQLSLEHSIPLDLSFGEDHHGLDISNIIKQLRLRQAQWHALKKYIPSMEAVPQLPENAAPKITDISIRRHLQGLVDGQSSLIDIAQKTGKDPLQIARSYLSWAQIDWIRFIHVESKTEVQSKTAPKQVKQSVVKQKNIVSSKNTDLPTILTVDDSPTVQSVIQSALEGKYNILLAKNAFEGFKVLNRQQIDLMLLDVNMPGINGLKMCKTLRNMPEFKELPIVMLTAQNTRVDKLKGQIAGSTHYLNKPFTNEELVNTIERYIAQKVTN